MSLTAHLLALLADGDFLPSSHIAEHLGTTPQAIRARLTTLRKLDLPLRAVAGRGYRLSQPLELLKHDSVRAGMTARALRLLSKLEILEEVDSTNSHLLRHAYSGPLNGSACLAELQHAGRGRQGRRWLSPFASNIYLSVLWRFATVSLAAGLSLAVGVAVVRTLRAAGITTGLGLKWPNDVLWQGRKLAGILIESAHSCHVVGVGLNVAMPRRVGRVIEQPWVDVHEILGQTVSRNHLAGNLLSHLLLAMDEFSEQGLSAFLPEWKNLDVLAGKLVSLQLPAQTIAGIVHGVADDGALQLCVNGVIQHYHAGETHLLPTGLQQEETT
jgi:BirA family biotin operon repressor/biotin-[acetyl-CoA-carboxylase] ligase